MINIFSYGCIKLHHLSEDYALSFNRKQETPLFVIETHLNLLVQVMLPLCTRREIKSFFLAYDIHVNC